MVALLEKKCPNCKKTITNNDLLIGSKRNQVPISEEQSMLLIDLVCKYCNYVILPHQRTSIIIDLAPWGND